METIKSDFSTRKKEIENYINFLNIIEQSEAEFFKLNDQLKNIDKISLQTTLKATSILLLYNLEESILTQCLDKIHLVICAKSIKYDQLNKDIQKLLLSYYLNSINKKNSLMNSIDESFEFVNLITQKKYFDLSYKELLKHYSLYSGNLDNKKIKNVLMKYGVSFNESFSELQDIKNKRNILAHGEESFEEVGRDISIQRIILLKNVTFSCANKIIEQVEHFISNNEYIS